MKSFRPALLVFCLLFGSAGPAFARVNIDLHLSLFPELVPIPGYPVYYAPRVGYNYFFYDGMYWLFEDDAWYVSAWYDGPWDYVDPYAVPVFVLRVPVRYYRRPPPYFRGWYVDAPPRWGHRWGERWEHDRRGWDHWDRQRIPVPARLPLYQRDYQGDRYPSRSEQRDLHERLYRPGGDNDGRRGYDHEKRSGYDNEKRPGHDNDNRPGYDNDNRGRPRDSDRDRPPQHRDADRDWQSEQRAPQIRRNPGDLQQTPRNVEHRNNEQREAEPRRGDSMDNRGAGRGDGNRQRDLQRGNGADKNGGAR